MADDKPKNDDNTGSGENKQSTSTARQKQAAKTVAGKSKKLLVSRRTDSVAVAYNGSHILIDAKSRVRIDPNLLDQKELPTGIKLV